MVDSWAFPHIPYVTDESLARYPLAGKLGFRDGSLIYSINGGKIYLISDNKRRLVTSPDVLENLGARWSDVITVSDEEINLQTEGEEIWE